MLADTGSRLALPSCPAVVKREREDMKLQAATVVPRVGKEVTKEEPPAVAACISIQFVSVMRVVT